MSGKSSKTVVTQVRLHNALDAQLSKAADVSGLAKNDVLKLALDIGLKILADNGYDLTKGVPSREMEEFLKKTILELVDDTVKDLNERLEAKGFKMPGQKK
jgi:hypothetical protein